MCWHSYTCTVHIMEIFHISNAILSRPLRAATVQQASRETGESTWWWWWWCVQYAHLSILHHRPHTEGGGPCRRRLWHYSNNRWDPDCHRVLLFIWLWPLWSDKVVICCCAGMWEARANDQEQNDAVFKVSDLSSGFLIELSVVSVSLAEWLTAWETKGKCFHPLSLSCIGTSCILMGYH